MASALRKFRFCQVAQLAQRRFLYFGRTPATAAAAASLPHASDASFGFHEGPRADLVPYVIEQTVQKERAREKSVC
jgi:hypothetical protein